MISQNKLNTVFAVLFKIDILYYWYIVLYCTMLRVAMLPGKLEKVREFENWPEKSENLKIDQKNQGEVRRFHKTDWVLVFTILVSCFLFCKEYSCNVFIYSYKGSI